ncbi:AAA family ATPase [Dehalobacter sp. 14DCB1]|uniref:AAA family ATPase n=1 Tax=Dehalobacter sp. 14DCB1 TaxID=2070227 RepID=UPI001FA95E88|nr:AAA family ATPase [Dehalobacter sp. 14DCB1]
MNKDLFYNWLKSFKKLDSTTSNTRSSNCLRIEKFYGDLDEQYNADRCVSLIEQLTYTTTDKKLENKPKHNIPIDGDIYNGTHTLKAALKLYIEFKDNKMIEELKTVADVEADKHDGSYELVRETVQALSTVEKGQLDIKDLDLLYFMVVGTWRSGIDVKRQKIRDSHLDGKEKEKLLAALDRVKEKAEKHEYENIEGEAKKLGWSIGMFGTGFHTFASKADKESAEEFISLCVDLKDMTDDEAMFQKTAETIKKGIRGMQSAAASVMLHCLKPTTFPIMNSAVNDTASLFLIEGVSLIKPRELEYYVQNARQLKKFRDEKCLFRNYRAMDMKLSIYGRSKETIEDEPDIFTIQQDDKINIWKVSHGNNGSFTAEERERYLDQSIITVHRETGKGQGAEFEKGMKIGDYFYLCHGNSGVKLLGKVTSEAMQLDTKTEGWLYRSYEVVAYSKNPDYQYSAPQKGWTPNYNSTAWRIPRSDFAEFEKYILIPCFDMKVQDLIFDEIVIQPTEEEPSSSSSVLELYSKEDFLNEVFISEQQYDEITILLNRKKNIILQGAPGVGKTYAAKRLAYSLMGCMDDARIEMIQFHQNYSYEDFVMGFRPVEGGGFELRTGIFHQFCIKASNDPTRDYYFVIDEINRGNLSKIFGELLMLIENDKRGSKFSVPLTYKPDSRFYVPQNVFVIGMMNTADRSLAMIDYALRRRFCFIEMEPAFGTQAFRKHLVDNGIHEDLIERIIIRMNYLNNQIAADSNLGRGFKIGHSYFCNPSTDENWYQSVIEYEINPLIEEYWFDNEEKAQEYMDYLLG